MRAQKEIEEQAGEASVWNAEGRTDVPGLTYEEGVEAALNWVLCNNDDKPIENNFQSVD
jgi:hypothetical protein